MTDTTFADALTAAGPAPDRGDAMNLYGWLIGAWDLEVTRFFPDGTKRRRPGEWLFGWTLEGRSIQDVWIVPPRGAARSGDAAADALVYGTTLRTYDPRSNDWLIQWTDPVTLTFLTMRGRKDGADIVQMGRKESGELARWSFRDIARDSFIWRGEVSPDDGRSWITEVEFSARRRGGT